MCEVEYNGLRLTKRRICAKPKANKVTKKGTDSLTLVSLEASNNYQNLPSSFYIETITQVVPAIGVVHE